MTTDELIDACGDGTGTLTLVINREPRGERIRLTKRGGPLGEILCVNAKNETVARFKKSEVLEYVRKKVSGVCNAKNSNQPLDGPTPRNGNR